MRVVIRTIDTADQLASAGQNQAAFRTYLAALTAATNILCQTEVNFAHQDRKSSAFLNSMFDTCSHCLDRARDLCNSILPPAIPPKALNRTPSRPLGLNSTRQSSRTSSLESPQDSPVSPNPISRPLSMPGSPDDDKFDTGPKSNSSIRIDVEEMNAKIDTLYSPAERRPPSHRTRARSLVSSIKARFDGTVYSENDPTLSTSYAASRMSLKTMFSSPMLLGGERSSSSSTLENQRSISESTKCPTPSLSEDDDGDNDIMGIDAVLGGLPISNVPNPEDLIEAHTSSDHPKINIPRIPKSPLVATLTKANGQLESAKKELVEFSKKATKPDDKEWPSLRRLQHTIASASATMEKVSRLTRVDAANPSFSMFPPSLVAYQLTRIESSIFHLIPPEALSTHSHRTPHPRIVASTDFFNYLTRIIELSILNSGEPEERALMIKFWIKVASSLESLCNFQTLQAVVSALATPPIQRLKRTWRLLAKRNLAILQASKRLMSEEDNYHHYRRHLLTLGMDPKPESPVSSQRQPIIPYLGVFIMDMTYLVALAKRQPASQPVSPTSSEHEQSRIPILLEAFQAYLSLPKHSASPPARFLKGHAKTSSMASFTLPFTRTTVDSGITNNMNFMSFLGEDTYTSRFEDLSDLRTKSHKDPDLIHNLQVVITHFILSQRWASEKIVDSKSQEIEAKPSQDLLVNTANLDPPTSTNMLSPNWPLSPAISSKSSSETSLDRVAPLTDFDKLALEPLPPPFNDSKPACSS